MTTKDIERVINRERRHVERLKKQRENLVYDIRATKESVRFWEKQLKSAKKKVR